jgi:ubiquinone/menaquinone biosynthesis C-methylase UbiE
LDLVIQAEETLMAHKFDPRDKSRLLTEERAAELRPEELLRSLGLKSGDTLADIGCGPGFFTIPGAQIVGERGRVLAGDVQGEMLSAVKARITEYGLNNVRVFKTSDADVPLPPGCADLVLLAFTLNEVEHRARFLHRAGRLLKPDARLAVVEWEKIGESEGPPVQDRLSPEELSKDAEAAGLRFVDGRKLNEHHYLSVFALARE